MREALDPSPIWNKIKHLYKQDDAEKHGLGEREFKWLIRAVGVVAHLSLRNIAYADSYARGKSPDWVIYDNVVRMKDKVERLANLASSRVEGREVPDGGEKINDTLIDLAGYCILMLSYISNNYTAPGLEEE